MTAPDETRSPFEEGLEEALQSRMRREDERATDPPWSPADADLATYAAEPDALAPALRARIDAYLAAHPAERDALEAFRQASAIRRSRADTTAAEPERPSLIARISSLLALPAVRLVPALALMLVVGVYVVGPANEEPLLRGDGDGGPAAQLGAAVQITLIAGAPMEIDAVAAGQQVDVHLMIPPSWGSGATVLQIERDGAPVDLDFPGPGGSNSLRLPEGSGRYEIVASQEGHAPLQFTLIVR